MRIGIDGTCWLNRRGYGRFARELVSGLAALDGGVEYTLVVDFDPARAPAVPPGIRVLPVVTRRPAAQAAAAAGRRSLADMWAISRAISRERFDIVFFPSAYTYVPVIGPGQVVVVVHDVIAEQFPEHVFPTRLASSLWWLKLLAARRQADLVMTVSEASRKGISNRFGIPLNRIVVVSEAADPLFRPLPRDARTQEVLRRFSLLDSRFVLYVGGISPHKNLGTLLEAFARLRGDPTCSDCHLVLVGDYSGDVFYSAYDELRQKTKLLGLGEAVHFTGYVADEDLVHLYSAAEVFVLPSLLEGFGLPVIEAMACGAPVVASRRGALPEVVGSAGLLFDPDRPGDLYDVLRRVLTTTALRDRLRQLGPQRAAEFSWERAAQQALSAFRSLVDGSC
jgi:glycosyltransferase involved in cell wall biosynthesis